MSLVQKIVRKKVKEIIKNIGLVFIISPECIIVMDSVRNSMSIRGGFNVGPKFLANCILTLVVREV